MSPERTPPTQEKNSQTTTNPSDLYVVCMTQIDSKSGMISLNTAQGPYIGREAAIDAMRKRYEEELRVRGLEDNNACDGNDESIPGGYFTDDEASIYNYVDFAFGQLLEVFSMTIKQIQIPN